MFIYDNSPALLWPRETGAAQVLVHFVKRLVRRKPKQPHADTLPPHLARDAGLDVNRLRHHYTITPFFRDHPRL